MCNLPVTFLTETDEFVIQLLCIWLFSVSQRCHNVGDSDDDNDDDAAAAADVYIIVFLRPSEAITLDFEH